MIWMEMSPEPGDARFDHPVPKRKEGTLRVGGQAVIEGVMMIGRQHLLTGVALVAGLGASIGAQNRSADWTQWRGPNRDGAIAAFAEPKAWPEKLNRKWKIDIGLGYASPLAVATDFMCFPARGRTK